MTSIKDKLASSVRQAKIGAQAPAATTKATHPATKAATTRHTAPRTAAVASKPKQAALPKPAPIAPGAKPAATAYKSGAVAGTSNKALFPDRIWPD